jgi:hypothetical protein
LNEIKANLIIFGINIKDYDKCQEYEKLCRKTAEGIFVNINIYERGMMLEEQLNRLSIYTKNLKSNNQPYITQMIDL